MVFIAKWFFICVYQPIANILLTLYALAERVNPGFADFGVIIISLTLLFRILWIPVSLASGKTYKENKELEKKIKEIKKAYPEGPVRKETIKKVSKLSKPAAIFSFVSFFVHFLIILALNRFFREAVFLQGPEILYTSTFKLTSVSTQFGGKHNLTTVSWPLNFTLALVLLLYEIITSVMAPDRNKQDIKIQIFLPLISLLVSAFIPSGVTLFVLTAVSFSIVFSLVKQLYFWSKALNERPEEKPGKK
ncbi:MAG: YidC/Oxa1 family membrane protein insertase [Patescibacteria group bacterium]|jgi:membrane protein insertase Oxa1/YidC/SpoIIIJ